jgi:hypothetical protein
VAGCRDGNEAEKLASAVAASAAGHQATNRTRLFLAAHEQLGAFKEMSATFSGTVFVTLSNTLQRFRKDMSLSENGGEWTPVHFEEN